VSEVHQEKSDARSDHREKWNLLRDAWWCRFSLGRAKEDYPGIIHEPFEKV
jgi:hypothetical protein